MRPVSWTLFDRSEIDVNKLAKQLKETRQIPRVVIRSESELELVFSREPRTAINLSTTECGTFVEVSNGNSQSEEMERVKNAFFQIGYQLV